MNEKKLDYNKIRGGYVFDVFYDSGKPINICFRCMYGKNTCSDCIKKERLEKIKNILDD